MGYYKLEDLEVYQLAERLANEVWEIAIKWDTFAKDTIGKQVVRSADSVGANIAEGHGRFHFKENKNFCYFSRGSLLETKTWLKKAKDRNLITDVQFTSFINQLEVIHLKLNAYIKFINTQNSSKPTID